MSSSVQSLPPYHSLFFTSYLLYVCVQVFYYSFVCFLKEKITPLFTPAMCYMTNLFAPLSPRLSMISRQMSIGCVFGREMKTKTKTKLRAEREMIMGGANSSFESIRFHKKFFFLVPISSYINGGKGNKIEWRMF
jgi:CBS domain containing-hemolysin-like protein